MSVVSIMKQRLSIDNERTRAMKINILLSLCLKPVGIILSLLIVPVTIDFVSPEIYGLWLTLSSIIIWFSHFDLGFANGFRNKFAEAKANHDIELAKKYISTTYAVLGFIFLCVAIFLNFINAQINWGILLNVSNEYTDEIRLAFYYLASFFCLNFVVNILSIFLAANQMPVIGSLITTIGQICSLLVIYVLSYTIKGSLWHLSFCITGVPCLILIISSFVIYNLKAYRDYRPDLSHIDWSKAKDIMGLGLNFFIVTIFVMVIFQFMNVIITRNLGPESVTQYNLAFKYMNISYMFIGILSYPLWSAFTDAYTKKEKQWMTNVLCKMDKVLLLMVLIMSIMILVSTFFFKLWIGKKVEIPFDVTIATAIYVFSMCCGQVYMMMINGIGKIRLQLCIYALLAIVAYPIMNYTCHLWGIVGVLILPTITYLSQAVLMRIQLTKLIGGTATGIWNK